MKNIFLVLIIFFFFIFINLSFADAQSSTGLSSQEKDSLCRKNFFDFYENYNDVKANIKKDPRNSFNQLNDLIDVGSGILFRDSNKVCLNNDNSLTYWGKRVSIVIIMIYTDMISLNEEGHQFRGFSIKKIYENQIYIILENILLYDKFNKNTLTSIKFSGAKPYNFGSSSSIDRDTLNLRMASLMLYLNALFNQADCTVYVNIYNFERNFIESTFPSDKKLYFEKRFSACERAISQRQKPELFLRASSLFDFIEKNDASGKNFPNYVRSYEQLNEERRKNLKIRIYVYNDYGFSRDEFGKLVLSFKKVILDKAPSYEFLGMERNAAHPNVEIVAKYIEHNRYQCEDKGNDLCVCNQNLFARQAKSDGADVYFVLTPKACRSWAIPGKHSVVSWTSEERPNSQHAPQYIIIHELGHLIWNLPDEYVEEGKRFKGGFPTCGKKDRVNIWWKHFLNNFYSNYDYERYGLVNHFEGCGYVGEEVYRPTEMSIMRSSWHFATVPIKNPIFGPVADAYIRKFMKDFKLKQELISKSRGEPLDDSENTFQEFFSADDIFYEPSDFSYYTDNFDNIYSESESIQNIKSQEIHSFFRESDSFLGHLIEIKQEGYSLTYENLELDFFVPVADLTHGLLVLNEDDLDYKKNIYAWELYSIHDEIILSETFSLSDTIYVSRDFNCWDDDNLSYIDGCDKIPSMIELDYPSTIISVPYSPYVKRLDIKNFENITVLSINMSEYASYCGDGVCGSSESFYSCPIDCEEQIFHYGLFEGKQLDFHVREGFITSNGPIDVVYSSGGCDESSNNCLEFNEFDEEIRVFIRSNSDIYVHNSQMYDVEVTYFQGTGHVIFETETSKVFISPTDIKTSFSDWDVPKITRTIKGVEEISVFDINTPGKLTISN